MRRKKNENGVVTHMNLRSQRCFLQVVGDRAGERSPGRATQPPEGCAESLGMFQSPTELSHHPK